MKKNRKIVLPQMVYKPYNKYSQTNSSSFEIPKKKKNEKQTNERQLKLRILFSFPFPKKK